MEEFAGKICPVCMAEIKEDDDVKLCPACGTAYHAACWEKNGGCAVPGCPEHDQGEAPADPADLCAICGEPLEGKPFCSNCGTPRREKKKRFCPNCGAELEDGKPFCPECGLKAEQDTDDGAGASQQPFGMYSNAGQQSAGIPKRSAGNKTPVIIAAVAGVLVIAALLLFFLLPSKPSSITLSRTALTLDRGDTYTLAYDIRPGRASDSAVTWRSDNDSIASVENGVVTANVVGSCKIEVVTENGKKDSCTVTVNMPAIEKKVVKTWRGTDFLNLEGSSGSLDISGWGWRLYLNNDNTGKFYMDSDSEVSFVWVYAYTNDYGNDVYMTSLDGFYFIYARDYGDIWFYINSSSTDVCITFE